MMFWINKLLQHVCAAIGVVALAASALAAPEADSTNAAPGRLLLCNGDSLDGNLVSIDAARVVRWKNADVAGAIEFKLDRVSQMDLRPPAFPDRGTNHPCKVYLTRGEMLEGSLISCDRDTLCLQAWYAGQLLFPRHQIQSVYFFPATPDLFTAAGPEGWTQGQAAGVLGVEAGEWSWRDGAFYAGKSASIARDVKLPDSAQLQFDLAWTGPLTLSLALYSDSLQPMLIADKDKLPDFGAFYSMRFQSLFVDVARIKKKENPIIYLPPVVVPAFSQTNRVHVEVRTRKISSTLALSINGQLLQVWHDTNGFAGEGSGVRFVHNGVGLIKLSNLRVADWDGVLEADQTNAPPAGQDTVWLTNNTFLSGVIESLTNGAMTLRGRQDSREIPLDRVSRLDFAPPQAAPPGELEGTVHATLANGGPVSFHLESWTAEGVNVRSPVFGRATFDPNAFRRLVFRPLDTAGGDATNSGTGP
jgi:sRNA-binding regulator protein Hfq